MEQENGRAQQQQQQREQEQQFFAVNPKTDCPHIAEAHYRTFVEALESNKKGTLTLPCLDCKNTHENWICMECSCVYCSRYVNGHMAAHAEKSRHTVVFSFSDASFWCYACDSYITNARLARLNVLFSNLKFGNETDFLKSLQTLKAQADGGRGNDGGNQGAMEVEANAAPDAKPQVKYVNAVDVLKAVRAREFKSITVLLGHDALRDGDNIDFLAYDERSEFFKNTLSKYTLPYQTAILDLFYYANVDVRPFNELTKFLATKPISAETMAHRLLRSIAQNVRQVVTLNVDRAEEIYCAVPREKIVYINGTNDEQGCTKCAWRQALPHNFKDQFKVDQLEPCRQAGCDGFIKVNIALSGEASRKSDLERALQGIEESDLVLALGFSFTDYPFSALDSAVTAETPVFMIAKNQRNMIARWKDFTIVQKNIDDAIKLLL